MYVIVTFVKQTDFEISLLLNFKFRKSEPLGWFQNELVLVWVNNKVDLKLSSAEIWSVDQLDTFA